MAEKRKVLMAVDLGASKYMTSFLTDTGEILYKKRYTWTSHEPEEVVRQIDTAIEEALSIFPDYAVQAMGMTIPGLADPKNGIWLNSDSMRIQNLPIARLVSDRFRFPVFIDNDCKACALAEKWFGSCKGCDHFVYITVSNGIGGALFLNGEVYYGAYGNAGEIGQCVVVENGRQAFEELTGTLEMYTSTSGLVKNYLEIGGSEWVNGQRLNGQVLAKRAAQGERDALLAFEKEGYYLGRVIASVCTVLDPEKVVLGGGLSLAYEFYRDSLESTVKKEFRRSAGLKIEPSVLGYDGALMGAAAIAMRGLRRA